MNCDHQFQNVTERIQPTDKGWCYTFVCPFCGQIRDVSKEGVVEIIVKGADSPKP